MVNAHALSGPAEICITFVKYVFSSTFTCSRTFLFVVSPKPNCPTLLYPVAHTVPSSFNSTVNPSPFSTCGTVIAPSLFLYTFIIAFVFKPNVLFFPVIVVCPIDLPITTPLLSIVATSSFDDSHVQSL